MLAQLEFKGFVLEEVFIKTRPAMAGAGKVHAPKVEIDLWKGEAGFDYLLKMSVSVGHAKADSAPYAITCSASGFFSFPTDTPADVVERLIGLNAPSVLYGAIRGTLAQSSACFQHGPYLLPAVNFVEILKAKSSKLKSKPAKGKSK